MTIETEKLIIKRSQPKKRHRLTLKDWISDYQKRKLTVRLPIELLVFLDQYAGYGSRATLMRRLLWSFKDRNKGSEFINSIERGKELEEEENQKRKQAEA